MRNVVRVKLFGGPLDGLNRHIEQEQLPSIDFPLATEGGSELVRYSARATPRYSLEEQALFMQAMPLWYDQR